MPSENGGGQVRYPPRNGRQIIIGSGATFSFFGLAAPASVVQLSLRLGCRKPLSDRPIVIRTCRERGGGGGGTHDHPCEKCLCLGRRFDFRSVFIAFASSSHNQGWESLPILFHPIAHVRDPCAPLIRAEDETPGDASLVISRFGRSA